MEHYADTASAAISEVMRSPGEPLMRDIRSLSESRFEHDFSRVRVHADSVAAESAQLLDAKAYTVGQHIVFGSDRYRPTAPDGKGLLFHELAHVVQQGSTLPSGELRISPRTTALEREAAAAARTGGISPVTDNLTQTSLQRAPADEPDNNAEEESTLPTCTATPPPTCSVCLLPPGGVTWAKGLAGPYIGVNSKGGATGYADEYLAVRDLKADPDCAPRRNLTKMPATPSAKKKRWWWPF